MERQVSFSRSKEPLEYTPIKFSLSMPWKRVGGVEV
jgi:hypothetical protein